MVETYSEVFCDGSSTNIQSAICIIVGKGVPIKKTQKKFVKVYDTPMAVDLIEYTAILTALRLIHEYNFPKKREVILHSDNQYVVDEINGLHPICDRHSDLYLEAKRLLNLPGRIIKVIWVPREKNLAGHHLEERLHKLKRYYKPANYFNAARNWRKQDYKENIKRKLYKGR